MVYHSQQSGIGLLGPRIRKVSNSMVKSITWSEVLARTDIVGGEIEVQETLEVVRGPIRAIGRDRDTIFFCFEWTAVLPNPMLGKGGHWTYEDKKDPRFYNVSDELITPSDLGEGRIGFLLAGVGMFVIFPKGGSRINRSNVQGLPENLR